jgi:soluble lytic murein transglycosylase-like protein
MLIPYINDVPVTCINQSAIEYHVPATLIISVLKAENGRVGEANRNANGTFDYGPMQVNSIWMPEIERAGYSQREIQNNPCFNVKVGTWILGQNIANSKNLWVGVGNYHSATSYYNTVYHDKVKNVYTTLNQYLGK